ncbi:MAG: hypothetical protein L0G07_06405, partial [Chryseobacterium sp.]|nr:hypothetical protein [Chryseobacterium sp.]
MKIKIFLGILVSVLIGIFFFSTKKKQKEGNILFYNTIEGVGRDSSATGKEKELLELCKVWGAIKYHSSDPDLLQTIDSSLIRNYNKIIAGGTDFNTTISQIIPLSSTNKTTADKHYIGFFPDKNWIENSPFIHENDK